MLIPDEVRKCVVFLLYADKDHVMHFAGTAFFVGINLEGYAFPHLVTAKHVIVAIRNKSADDKVYIRINDNSGGSQLANSEIGAWAEHPSDTSVDVAVLRAAIPHDPFDYLMIPTNMFATDELMKSASIGLGDEVYITGLFVNHVGKNRNIPIVRVGNIASMPEEKVDTSSFGSIEAYLIEARSIGGLSGSPVFVHKPVVRVRNGALELNSNPYGEQYLLGLIHGHWDRRLDDLDELAGDNAGGIVNMGIAMVVPATKILEIIKQPKWMEEMQAVVDAEKKKKLPV